MKTGITMSGSIYRLLRFFGCIKSFRNVAIIIVIVIVTQCVISSADNTFTKKLNQMLRTPSRHGEKAGPWNPNSLVRKRRSLDETFLPGDSDYYGYGEPMDEDCGHESDLHILSTELYKGPVCDIIDARNNPIHLKDLENCTIVNGFVQIIFMHDITEEDLVKYRFPKLRVITHYLLVFRIFNLRSLRYMFPNLAVIGGLELFREYSLVIYENPHLTEIGLGNLQIIRNGAVRIEKNGNLCYLTTIDWERLAGPNKDIDRFSKNVIRENRSPDQCVDQCGDISQCDKIEGKEFCWGIGLCQKKHCPKECEHSCVNDTCVCHSQCQAGCTRPNDPTACIACKDKYYNNTCLSECPAGTYLIHGWLCITKVWCRWLGWTLHNNTCQLSCPAGYEVEHRDCVKQCVKCDFDCGKVCPKTIEIIDHRSLTAVRACKEIEGALIININGGSDIVKELDDAFKDLEVIGSLVVRRSFPLVSLSFLRKVRRITGVKMEQEMYSVYVLDNQNLKELWDFKKSNLTIDKGKAFFHFNPHLCMQEVEKVEQLTKGVEDDKDISALTNGDMAVCNMELIKILKIEEYDRDWAVVKIWWENTVVKDPRTLIGYQIFYKPSPQKNATKYEGVDACGHNSWTIVDKAKSEVEYPNTFVIDPGNDTNADPSDLLVPTKPGNTSKLLTSLDPFTQYAFYIKAYTTSTARRGAESEIHYFTTKTAEPSKPENLKAYPMSTSSIKVRWSPPAKPNGKITHYIVEWRRQHEEDLKDIRAYDACKQLYRPPSKPPTHIDMSTDQSKTRPPGKDGHINENCCSCEEEVDIGSTEAEAEDSRAFENYIQDELFFYVPELPPQSWNDSCCPEEDSLMSKRFRRDLRRVKRGTGNATTTAPPVTRFNNSDTTTIPTTTATPEPTEYQWQRVIVNSTSVNITDLHHYSEYDIMVYACNHDADPQSQTDLHYKIRDNNDLLFSPSHTPCSMGAITSRRTMPSVQADVIPKGSVNVTVKQNQNAKGEIEEVAELMWRMPIDPNAYVKTFSIEINSTEERNERMVKTFCTSLNSSVKDTVWFPINASQIGPGAYSARVRPETLAGEGNWTEPVSFAFKDLRKSFAPTAVIVVLCVLVALSLIGLVIVAIYCKTRRKPMDPSMLYADMNPEYSRFVYIPDEYEIEVEKVTIMEEIGHGNFGKVFAGVAKSIVKGQDETMVAIKKLHENANPSRRFEFLKEASMMKAFNAHHVVRLLGVVSKAVDPMVIMEFMEKGDLKSHLRSRRPGSEENPENLPPPTLQEKLQMAAEIADGMMYLADNKFVHRDLAARNCLVHTSGTVKIGDFGLTRDIYEMDYYRKESRGFLPIRWMAPESLKDGIFDTRTDVWSYGVVLWELATLAEQPYQGQQHDEVTRFVIDGGYMERPKDCPRRLYDLMTTCWQYNPKMRPDFKEIVQELYNDVSDEFKECCYLKSIESEQEMEDSEGQFLTAHDLPPGGTFLLNEMSSTPSPGHQYTGTNMMVPHWLSGNPEARYVELPNVGPTSPQPLIENEEKRGLLQPFPDHGHHDDVSYHHSGGSRSPNTTTTALTPPSSGDDRERARQRNSSESSYENDYEDLKKNPHAPLQTKDPNLGDSGTFVVMSNPPKDLDPLISYSHLNGGHKKKSRNLELDLESGVDEGHWGNSSSPSVSNPPTPTETQAMLSL